MPSIYADNIAKAGLPLIQDVTVETDNSLTDNIKSAQETLNRDRNRMDFCQRHPGYGC